MACIWKNIEGLEQFSMATDPKKIWRIVCEFNAIDCATFVERFSDLATQKKKEWRLGPVKGVSLYFRVPEQPVHVVLPTPTPAVVVKQLLAVPEIEQKVLTVTAPPSVFGQWSQVLRKDEGSLDLSKDTKPYLFNNLSLSFRFSAE